MSSLTLFCLSTVAPADMRTFIGIHQSGWIPMLRRKPPMIAAQRQTSCQQVLYGNERRPSFHGVVSASLGHFQSRRFQQRFVCQSCTSYSLYFYDSKVKHLVPFCTHLIYLQVKSPALTSTHTRGCSGVWLFSESIWNVCFRLHQNTSTAKMYS